MSQKISQLMMWKRLDSAAAYNFSVDCYSIDVAKILDTYKYLMKKHDIK